MILARAAAPAFHPSQTHLLSALPVIVAQKGCFAETGCKGRRSLDNFELSVAYCIISITCIGQRFLQDVGAFFRKDGANDRWKSCC